jgi:hypothetical protein
MLPDSAFPGPLPLSRKAALDLLDRLVEFNVTGGTFLTFVMRLVCPFGSGVAAKQQSKPTRLARCIQECRIQSTSSDFSRGGMR